MSQDKTMSFAIICLAVSIVIAAVILSSGLQNAGVNVGANIGSGLSNMAQGIASSGGTRNTETLVYARNTYDLPTAATYLGITEQQLLGLVTAQDSGIPYLKLGNTYAFGKNALDKWLETARVNIN